MNIYSIQAVRFVITVLLLSLLSPSAFAADEVAGQAMRPVSEYVQEDRVYTVDVSDPLEGFNRRVYKFNAKFDKYVFLPATRVYDFILPDIIQNRISNFFSNIFEIRTLMNAILQFKPKTTAKTTGRFVINTTLGIAGMWDPATKMGITKEKEDFGQTLGRWGVGNGPYIVLPILGPSNLRDTAGLAVDGVAQRMIIDGLEVFDETKNRDGILYGLYTLAAIDKRNQESFRYYESGSPFEYEWIRLLYTKYRQIEIAR